MSSGAVPRVSTGGDGALVRPLPRPTEVRSQRPVSIYVSLLAALVAALTVWRILVGLGGGGVLVAEVANDVAAGQPVGADSVRYVHVSAPQSTAAQLVTRDHLSGERRVATHALSKGTLLSVDDITTAATSNGLRAISIPVEPAHAAGGSLRPGDTVDVISAEGTERYVATGLRVLAADTPDGGGALRGPAGKYSVTVEVNAEQALAIAAAIAANKVDLVKASGAPPVSATPAPAPTRR